MHSRRYISLRSDKMSASTSLRIPIHMGPILTLWKKFWRGVDNWEALKRLSCLGWTDRCVGAGFQNEQGINRSMIYAYFHRLFQTLYKICFGSYAKRLCYLQCKSFLSLLRLWLNSVDKQKPPELGNLFYFDHQVAGKLRLISYKWQTKLNETQQSDLRLVLKGEKDKVICLGSF